MDCDPESLLAAAACFRCFSERVASSVEVYLLCGWGNGGSDPEEQGFLLEDEGGFFLLDDGGRIMVQT